MKERGREKQRGERERDRERGKRERAERERETDRQTETGGREGREGEVEGERRERMPLLTEIRLSRVPSVARQLTTQPLFTSGPT